MATKKKTDENTPRNFKDKSSNWFLNFKHFHLNEKGDIELISGGLASEDEFQIMQDFVKRNKKVFVPREKSKLVDFENNEVKFDYVFKFGRYASKTIEQVANEDLKYLKWLDKNFTFTAEHTELKKQLKLILGK